MKEVRLFRSREGSWITSTSLRAAMDQVGAGDCEVLYMHTELSFGMPNPDLSRQELLGALYETVGELGVPTLCVPTFTFSFCNGVDYDVRRSKSRMGVLNEYIRKQDESVRSVDPLMSVAVVGREKDLAVGLGHHSIGVDSTFDRLHHKKGVKFLFFGASLSKCFTYTHYVEEREGVPYRYQREFSGRITDAEGRTCQDSYVLFVRYRNVVPSAEGKLEQLLLERGLLRRVRCGDSFVSCVDEPPAYETIESLLRSDIDVFLAEPYPRKDLDRTFKVRNMVAL